MFDMILLVEAMKSNKLVKNKIVQNNILISQIPLKHFNTVRITVKTTMLYENNKAPILMTISKSTNV